MAATTSCIPLEEYLRSDYEPDAEYVRGTIEERPMGEFEHAAWQDALSAWFRLHAAEWNVRSLPEYRIRVAPNTFRVPDVTLLDRSLPVERVATRPPLAVFEILSPEDTVKRALTKLAEYEAMGIPQIWIIDPEDKLYLRYHEGSLEPATHFGEPGHPIYFAMAEIAAYLD